MRGIYLRFPCGNLFLEGALSWPQGAGPFAAVVVCHPHPLYGDTMDNNVVLAVCQALCRESMVAFRFNFRGVGGSQGALADGFGDPEDVKAAISYVSAMENIDPGRIGLVGYSFGGGVALRVAPQDERVQAVAAISASLTPSSLGLLRGYAKPKLLVCGSSDHLVPSQELQRLADELPEPKKCQVISGADHFWMGYEGEVAATVASFLAEALARKTSKVGGEGK